MLLLTIVIVAAVVGAEGENRFECCCSLFLLVARAHGGGFGFENMRKENGEWRMEDGEVVKG